MPSLDLLHGIEQQKEAVAANVMRLAEGHAAHDMLLWGSRGMGKSALTRASVLAAQQAGGAIALVQVAPDALPTLSALFATGGFDRRLVFIDDLGLKRRPSGPRALRSWLEAGWRRGPPMCALPSRQPPRHRGRTLAEQDDPINPRDVVDDKLALADRFGLSIGFHACSQDDYLAIIAGYAGALGLDFDAADALEWSKRRGRRSGRIAWHYVNELAGRAGAGFSLQPCGDRRRAGAGG
jgi:predicted AAA+ superfamily ATPase